MLKSSAFYFIIVTFQFLSLYGELQGKIEDEEALCLTIDVLCVKDVILKISKAAKDIHNTAFDIERNMWRKEKNNHSLQQNINRIRKRIVSYTGFPSSKYHDQFSETNNINKNDLVHLMIEEHDAVSYLYDSMKHLLPQSFFDHEYDELFYKILENLQHNMLCNYRNILRVYSDNWQPTYPKNGIRVRRIRKREVTSFDYRAYAIIILEVSRQWIEKIEDFINNLENKLI